MSQENEGGAATEVAPAETQTQEAEAPAVEQNVDEGGQSTSTPSKESSEPVFDESMTPRQRAKARWQAEKAKAAAKIQKGDGTSGDETGSGDSVVETVERRRDPKTGHFLPKDEGGEPQETQDEGDVTAEAAEEVASEDDATPTEAASTGVAEDEGVQDDQTETEATDKSPSLEGAVRIPLPEDHPLREMGQDSILADPKSERAIRAAINSYTRRKEVEEARAEADRIVAKAQEEAIRLRAQLEASTSLRQKLLNDPEIRNEYEIIRATNPKAAERWLRGLEAEQKSEVDELVQEEVQKHRAERQAEQEKQAIASFRSEVTNLVQERYPQIARIPGIGDVLERAYKSYGSELHQKENRGEDVSLDLDHFVEYHLKMAFGTDPRVRHHLHRIRQEREREKEEARKRQAETKASEAAKEREKKHLREAAERHKTKNPAGQIPSEVRTGAKSTDTAEDHDFRGVPASEIKKTMKERIRTRR